MKSERATNLRKKAPIPTDRCGMAMAAELLGERWALLILREVFYGVACFEDMRTDLKIPPATLKKRLTEFEAAEILDRVEYQAPNDRPRSGYRLTPAGRELALTVLALRQWGDKWLKSGKAESKLVDRSTGDLLKVALVNKDGSEVPVEQSKLMPLEACTDE